MDQKNKQEQLQEIFSFIKSSLEIRRIIEQCWKNCRRFMAFYQKKY